jgi:hypothetical protein
LFSSIKQGSKGRQPLGGVWGAPTKSLFSRGGVGKKRTVKSPW